MTGMWCARLIVLLSLSTAALACGAERGQPAQLTASASVSAATLPVVESAAPSAASVHAAASAPASAASTTPSAPPQPLPYPDAWAAEARSANPFTCARLVYKDGCRALRRGRIQLEVELDADGAVTRATVLSDTIEREPVLVEKCVLKEVGAWRYHAPEGYERKTKLELIFSDKC